jgi:hypothetical protein
MKTTNRLLALVVYCTLACLSTRAATNYVWQASPNPLPPYTNWPTAAHVIQEAVDIAQPGDTILITDGVYETGGRSVGTDLLVSRVVVEKPITLRSANGPAVTSIVGAEAGAGGNGDGAIRCAYLGAKAALCGFTLTNGHTRTHGGTNMEQSCGGGVWCASASALVSNCTLSGNSAYWGGAANGGTLNRCVLINNSAAKGGGATQATLNHCTLIGNSAGEGGGVSMCALNNCLLTGNSAANGGGACCSWLNNCTLTGNWANYGGGAGYATTLRNCIVYYNGLKNSAAGDSSPTLSDSNHAGSTLGFCCTVPMPTNGIGNIINAPRFVDLAAGNLRLQPDSPCIDAGTNAYVSSLTDLDGRLRIVGRGVDMGAYEF